MKEDYEVPLPNPAQLAYHKEELAAFIHFGMNTFYEREWGDGTEDPSVFNPSRLDADQWVSALKDAGFKRVILVVKHHDGFVLYPSKYTDFTVAASPWKGGRGDVLLEVSRAASKYDMGLGIYLSPWDAHDERYTIERQDEYNTYYLNQLEEILENPQYGNNGKFVEIWMDSARGEGAQKVTYDFGKWFEYIKSKLGEDVCIFSSEPTSVRWIGNESGVAGDPLYQRICKHKMSRGEENDPDYLNHGDKYGDLYSVGEADVSIRSGWFYEKNQSRKSLHELVDIYFNSIGRGAPLLLNVPPTKEGILAEEDIQSLKEFKKERDRIRTSKISTISNIKSFDGEIINGLLEDDDVFCSLPPNYGKTSGFTIYFDELASFDLIEIKECIDNGQRICAFQVEVWSNGSWHEHSKGNTIGAKRLIREDKITTEKIKITILESMGLPSLKYVAFYDSGIPRASKLFQNNIE